MSKNVIKEIAVYRNGCFIKRSGTINLKQGKHTVTIDCLPQSLDSSMLALYLPENASGSNVQVELLDEDTGIITWDFDIELSENKVIDLAYSVSWPKDRTINI